MGLIERLFGSGSAGSAFDAAADRAHESARLERAEAQASVAPAWGPTLLGSAAVPYVSGATAAGVSAVWRCVTAIADLVASFEWGEWVGDDRLPEPHRLIRKPCATMTRREWTWRVVGQMALYSTQYLLHVGGTDSRGAPWSLLPLPPSIVVPLDPDPWGILPASRYLVAGREYSDSDLTVIRRAPFPGVSDEFAGVLNLARRQFGAFLAADTHMARYWQNGGPVVTQITSDQEIDDTEAETIGRRWQERRQLGADFPAVFGKGAEAKPWGADPTTESAVEARREMVAEVGRYFGFPTRILNAPAGDSETYSNVENDAVDLYRYTLIGYMNPVEDAITDLLAGDAVTGHRMSMDASWYLQGDLPSRSAAWAQLVTAGIADADEARVRGFGLKARGTSAPAAAPRPPEALPAGVTVSQE